jgi:hypothetical protein
MSGFWLQQDTFSESGFSVKYGELRAFPPTFRGMQLGFSAVETSWRRMQSRANPSPPEFPANREKYREIYRIPRRKLKGWSAYGAHFTPLVRPHMGLCLEPNREWVAGSQGIEFLVTGLQSFIPALDLQNLVAIPERCYYPSVQRFLT